VIREQDSGATTLEAAAWADPLGRPADQLAAERISQTAANGAPALRPEPLLKRPLDLLLSGGMLLVSAPVWAAIGLAIKLEDGGPIFYQQERWGRGGTRFRIRKFRSMRPEAGHEAIRQASASDSRVTRVGRLLRATGLDELPQLLSIFRGEMSFVGPRALAVGERDASGNPLEYERQPGFQRRVSVRPGLTGLATVNLPKDAPPEQKFQEDQRYVDRLSFGLDLRLIALSFWISFRGKWETRGTKV
jgi:lipopolysaccharide/colanic/teichoic acid biosynthesis glycosyltransferase